MRNTDEKSPVVEFRTGEVQRLSGLTKYMVDYLCRHGLLSASLSQGRGYGKRRLFSFTDILLARSLKKLLAGGISVLALRTVMAQLHEELNSDSPAVLRDTRVVIRGRKVYLSKPDRFPSDLMAGGQLSFSFVLEIEELWDHAEPIRAARRAAEVERLNRALRIRRERKA